NSPEIYSTMNMQFPITWEDTTKWFERTLTNDKRVDFAFYEGEVLVSMTGLTGLDLQDGLIEFYIMVGPEYQGKGYGKQSTIWTINYAFLKYNINKIVLYTNGYNDRANKLYEKLGFQLEGKLRQHKFRSGRFIDRCIYGLLRDDWVNQSYH